MSIDIKRKLAINVVITVHGIRTFGQWQERLAGLVRQEDPDSVTYSYHYGFFSVLAFLLPPLRGIEISRFRRHLQRILDKHPNDRISLIGHSFGTHLIAWALAEQFQTPRLPLQQIILAGSVLRSTFDWHELVDKGLVLRVVNDCGIDDGVLLLSQVCVLFTGMAGRLGFTGPTGMQLSNRYFRGGHSHYFVDVHGRPVDTFMEQYWLPLLLGTGEPEEVDQRVNGGPLQGLQVWMIQNADVFKVGALVFIGLMGWQKLYATPRALAEAESLARLRTVALQQISLTEQTPQGVANLLNVGLRDQADAVSRDLAAHWLPQLESYQNIVVDRGLPAMMVWNGRNLLVTKNGSADLGGAVIESYGFSRDGAHLITFDASRSIRLFRVVDAKQLHPNPASPKTPTSIELHAKANASDSKVSNSTSPLPNLSKGELELSSFDGDMTTIDFRESPDGTYLWGIGSGVAQSTGNSESILFAINLKTLAYASYGAQFGDILFLSDEKRLRTFTRYRPDTPDAWKAGRNLSKPSSSLVELRWPEKGGAFTAFGAEGNSPSWSLSDALIHEVERKGKNDLLQLRIGSMASNRVRASSSGTNSEENEGEISSPLLVYPELKPARKLWTVSKRPKNGPSSSDLQWQSEILGLRTLNRKESVTALKQLRAYITGNIDHKWPAMYLGQLLGDSDENADVLIADRGSRVTYLLRGSDGGKYGVTVFCVAKNTSSKVEFCDFIRTTGEPVRLALSDDGRYLAIGSDKVGLDHSGIYLRDLSTSRTVETDESVQGIINSLTFPQGESEFFASTPYGVWQYRLANETAKLVRRYEVPGRAVERARGNADYRRNELQASATLLFHVSFDGVVQALSRKTGVAEWLVRLPLSSSKIIYDASTQVLAIHGSQCVHLLHAPTGGRISEPLCIEDLPQQDIGPETKEKEEVVSVRFEGDGTLNAFTNSRQFSRKIVSSRETIDGTERTAFLRRWPTWVNLGDTSVTDERQIDWIERTGHDFRVSPVRAITELPRATVKQATPNPR